MRFYYEYMGEIRMITLDEKDQKNNQLNIVIKNEEESNDVFVLSIRDIFQCLRRFAAGWLVLAILAALVVSAGTALTSHQLSSSPVAVIGFDYDGADEGVMPNGEAFDVNSIKNPTVIEAALTKLGYSLDNVESVRSAISIEGILPSDAADQISVYKYAYEENGSLQAADAMLNVSYFPTTYRVTFNFTQTSFGDDEAAQVMNTVLECYRDYFYETYGFSTAVGNASLAVDYTDYDYLVTVDTYNTTLTALQDAVNEISDSTGFRSTETGYSFDDLKDLISMTRSYESDTLLAYILSNGVVRDKENMVSYYEYQLDALERSKTSAEEKLEAIEASIAAYEKDAVVMFGDADDLDDSDAYASYTKSSEKYDQLFSQKSDAQNTVSRYVRQITECKERLNAVKKLSSSVSDQKIDYVEEHLEALGEKINQMVEDVNTTITEYNESVGFANAYSILVPASVPTTSYVSMLLKNVMKPLAMVEAVVLIGYLLLVFVEALVMAVRKKRAEDAKQQAAKLAPASDAAQETEPESV